jgi:colanic acid biosynthesis glycosyl transferase WcaI
LSGSADAVKICYVSQYFPPEMGAPAARVSELSRHWAAAGHEVTVLTGFPNHPTGVVPVEYVGQLWRLVMREQNEGIKVVRTWLWPLPNRKSHERIRNYTSFALSAAATGSLLKKPSVIIATSPQLLVGLAGWWISRIQQVPFVFEVRDLWPESLVSVGVSGPNSLLVRSLRRIARFLYRTATHVVVVTPAFRTRLVNDWGVPPEKISVVENGIETDVFTPGADAAAARAEFGLEGRFVVSYIGTLGNAHGLETLLDAAARLEGRLPGLRVLLVGEGAEKERLMRTAGARGLLNVQFISQQPRAKIPALLAASDVCVVLLKESDIFKTVIPTKMLEMMSCARPVVLGVDGQAREVLERAGGGIAVPPGRAAELAQAIELLAADAGLRQRYGQSGRDFIVRHASRASTAESYARLLQEIVAQGERRG